RRRAVARLDTLGKERARAEYRCVHELSGEPLVEVTRGAIVESIHRVAVCAMRANGDVLLAIGTIDTPVYLRSSSKPFIAAAAIAVGVREAYRLEQHEIAVMAA